MGTVTRRGFARLAVPALAGRALLRSQSADHRIRSVKSWVVPLAVRYRPPKFASDDDPERRRAFGPFSQLAGAIVVQIETGGGLTGFGLGGGGGAAAYIIDHHLRDLLIGADARKVELIWDQLHASTSFYGRRGLAIMAISGIDLALWDIAGKAAGLPVYRAAGSARRGKVAAYFTSAQPERGLEMGFRAFKLPIVGGVAQGREGMKRIEARIAEVRKLIGPECELMIDCLARWDVEYTLEMAQRLAEHRLRWIEEPLLPDDIAGYETLCSRVRGTLITSGEHEYTRWGFGDLIRHKAVQVLQPDISWSGGFSELRRIARLAEESRLPMVPHRGGSLYGLNLILATTNCELAESFGIGERGNEVMQAMTPRFERGWLLPPEGPGFGCMVDEAMLRKVSEKTR